MSQNTIIPFLPMLVAIEPLSNKLQVHIPVIGVPVRASQLDGLDSLLSIVQMPRGPRVEAAEIERMRECVWGSWGGWYHGIRPFPMHSHLAADNEPYLGSMAADKQLPL